MEQDRKQFGLYDHSEDKSSCGVGFITRKTGEQTHDVLVKGHEALCTIPHRGGMSAEGVGDGAGVNVDISQSFFRKLTGNPELNLGEFGVGNFFLPENQDNWHSADALITAAIEENGCKVILSRMVDVDNSVIRPAAVKHMLPIRQVIFTKPNGQDAKAFDRTINEIMLKIESQAYEGEALKGLYPLSLSARTQVYKGRLNSDEIIPYFKDLMDEDHKIHTMFFHTRFSTNTEPQSSMAQPFRFMAHNGELNTDKKNRLSEAAIAQMRHNRIYTPHGQSDSARLDQTLQRRLIEDDLDLITAVVAMMPPAWENDTRISNDVRIMLEYFSLYEEKNDGPAALIFGDGTVVGARLDRLGLRPMRSVETGDYLCVMSEAGQIDFPADEITRRGRIEAGGMLYFDHRTGKSYTSHEALEMLANAHDYKALLEEARVNIKDLPAQDAAADLAEGFTDVQRAVAYSLNQESYKFLMDPMMQTGAEKISAMGYGVAINALSDQEGGMAKFFSQRFAQVTNPPLDSLREADGMTLRVALGAKPHFNKEKQRQIVIDSPILNACELATIRAQDQVPVSDIAALYQPVAEDCAKAQQNTLINALEKTCDQIEAAAREKGGIIILSDAKVDAQNAPLPLILLIAAANQRLIEKGLRFRASLVAESGQIASSHQVATALGFGASALMPLSVIARANEMAAGNAEEAKANVSRFIKAAKKSLMKTMGKVGLCTAESYIGGEFFEPNFLDTNEAVLARFFPNMKATVGGVDFAAIALSNAQWHQRACEIKDAKEIPLLGLFKERSEGAGHSYGTTAVRGFVEMTEEGIKLKGTSDKDSELDEKDLSLLTLNRLKDAYDSGAEAYRKTSFERRTPKEIDSFKITKSYREFSQSLAQERAKRPAALRDVLSFPADVNWAMSAKEFAEELFSHDLVGNSSFLVRGIDCDQNEDGSFTLRLCGRAKGRPAQINGARLDALKDAIIQKFGDQLNDLKKVENSITFKASGQALYYFSNLQNANQSLSVTQVQPAHEVTATLASGAMSHGALVAPAHEAVAHGTNMAGAFSNSGEGGEHYTRYGTIRSSRIKQLASGRFGVWTGYLADPTLEELEIKIAQGAKPGEGGQLPGPKVTVEIAAARGGTPGVELVSPPPHHDTYSIEDLAQLIHDAKAARVRVIVKLVSSEGIGTIAVGVAKAGADVINVAGNTGGTGAAAVTSLKNTGRAAEIGLAEVHQALCANGLRDKVILRCSGAHQTGSDVVKSALLGGDSFEFGTTALMMIKCVMAKNCNIKCPAGITTNAEVFEGDPRALAQYLINIAHEVREILARLGFKSLQEARGRADYLHLVAHERSIGQLDLRQMLTCVPEVKINQPVYLEANFDVDDELLKEFRKQVIQRQQTEAVLSKGIKLNNRNKTVGGQLAIDIERTLQYELSDKQANCLPMVYTDDRGRRLIKPETLTVNTTGAAGQSYAAFCNSGMIFRHVGTCNDGVGKGASGGNIAIVSPGGGDEENVLIGNFALFGASGSALYVEGGAGDRFGVRNSGASAVVEGVGDFCGEYMTNGAILNLGDFGKGFCNGMSGGVAYQYDPYDQLEKLYSADSVKLHRLSDDNERAAIHRLAVKSLLERHVKFTGSKKAQFLLDNFATEVANFRFATPLALETYQNYEAILKAKSRKELVEELSQALVAHQTRKFKEAYRDGKPIADGAIPSYGETDTALMYTLINNYTVWHCAEDVVKSRYKKAEDLDQNTITSGVRKLILTEDFALNQKLAGHARKALESFGDEELAVMISDKRMKDYKTALSNRNVRLMDSIGTYGWILLQDRQNRQAMGEIPDFEMLFAKASSMELVKQMV
ncbi:glutamate synthase-related protein [Polycladidibacter hongkongensis]|uniref:glutamate synthase-related protein n=1 Tax=Polycladidibacter hongkongensis TaxID=1647556 RepID=UPI0008312D66|nr:glutamate synthase-related protein [Pseudovibrio hongkongensis]